MSENKSARSTWRFLQVLVNPGRAFEKIVAEPVFIKAAFGLCGINLLLAIILAPKMQALTTWMLTHGRVTMPPEEMERVLAVAPKAAAGGSVVAAAVTPWFIWLLIAGLLKLFAMFSARDVAFKTLLAVAV